MSLALALPERRPARKLAEVASRIAAPVRIRSVRPAHPAARRRSAGSNISENCNWSVPAWISLHEIGSERTRHTDRAPCARSLAHGALPRDVRRSHVDPLQHFFIDDAPLLRAP